MASSTTGNETGFDYQEWIVPGWFGPLQRRFELVASPKLVENRETLCFYHRPKTVTCLLVDNATIVKGTFAAESQVLCATIVIYSQHKVDLYSSHGAPNQLGNFSLPLTFSKGKNQMYHSVRVKHDTSCCHTVHMCSQCKSLQCSRVTCGPSAEIQTVVRVNGSVNIAVNATQHHSRSDTTHCSVGVSQKVMSEISPISKTVIRMVMKISTMRRNQSKVRSESQKRIRVRDMRLRRENRLKTVRLEETGKTWRMETSGSYEVIAHHPQTQSRSKQFHTVAEQVNVKGLSRAGINTVRLHVKDFLTQKFTGDRSQFEP
eukprot:4429814-Amphidinium_carterae.1